MSERERERERGRGRGRGGQRDRQTDGQTDRQVIAIVHLLNSPWFGCQKSGILEKGA